MTWLASLERNIHLHDWLAVYKLEVLASSTHHGNVTRRDTGCVVIRRDVG
jgi:hypothetical protein